MTANKKSTSKKVASDASKEMKSPKKAIRSISASDVSQVNPKKETWKKVASTAGKVLGNPKSTKKEKEVAASALAQAPRTTKSQKKVARKK